MAKVSKIAINKESLTDFVNRYRVLSNEQFVSKFIMKEVTKKLDLELKQRMESLPTHPKDTGLMQKSWRLPEKYLNIHTGTRWEVYLENTATVGQQSRLKDAMVGRVHRKRKRVGRHNNKRYMPFVDERTKFYTKQLRVVRNKINPIFRETVYNALYNLYQLRPDLASKEEMASVMRANW